MRQLKANLTAAAAAAVVAAPSNFVEDLVLLIYCFVQPLTRGLGRMRCWSTMIACPRRQKLEGCDGDV